MSEKKASTKTDAMRAQREARVEEARRAARERAIAEHPRGGGLLGDTARALVANHEGDKTAEAERKKQAPKKGAKK